MVLMRIHATATSIFGTQYLVRRDIPSNHARIGKKIYIQDKMYRATRSRNRSYRHRTLRNNSRTLRTNNTKPALTIETIFSGLSGFQTSIQGLEKYTTTYGEVSETAIPALSSLFETYGPLAPMANKTFYDLGCGIGKNVIGLAMLHPLLQSKGIDIVPERIQQARIAHSRLPAPIKSRVEFREGDFLDTSVNLSDACWIFISNLCLPENIQAELAKKIQREVKPRTTIICSKDMPFEGLAPPIRKSLSMTWAAESTVLVYIM